MKKIYAVANPMWYADTFIFSYMEDFGCYVYVKVNPDNKIEEIGINLERRMHNTRFEDMDKTEASRLQKSIFNRIGEEYWWGLYKQYQRNSIKSNEERAREEMQEAKLVVYPHAIKHAFLKCGKEGKVIHEMYGNEFDSITPNRIKYLSFLKKVELDNRFDELNEILNKYGK